MKSIKAFIFAACAFAGAAAFADNAALPQESTQGSVHYINGGIGKDESDAMKQAEKQYPLALEFSEHATSKGDFVADVRLTIEDKAGNTVLQADSLGPFVLVKVPDGKYTIKAERGGKTQVRQVAVSGGKSDHLSLSW